MDSGWIKLHRAILDKPVFRDCGVFSVFVRLLLTVSYDGRGETDAGWRVVSRATLAKETGMTEQSVRTALKKLADNGTIRLVSVRGRRMGVQIVNWSEYQTNQPTFQPTFQPTNQPTERTMQPIENADGCDFLDKPTNQPTNQLSNQLSNQLPLNSIEENKRNYNTIPACACAREDFSRITPEEVVGVAKMQGCNWSLETARLFLAHYNSVGWMLPNGSKVVNWRARVKVYDCYEKDKAGRERANGRRREWDTKTVGRPEDYKQGVLKWE